MSLKIPGVGKTIKDFEYDFILDNKENVIVRISYCIDDKETKVKSFELRCDDRFKTQELIVNTVSKHLSDAKTRKKVGISEYKERVYVDIGDSRFTGVVLSEK